PRKRSAVFEEGQRSVQVDPPPKIRVSLCGATRYAGQMENDVRSVLKGCRLQGLIMDAARNPSDTGVPNVRALECDIDRRETRDSLPAEAILQQPSDQNLGDEALASSHQNVAHRESSTTRWSISPNGPAAPSSNLADICTRS